MSEFTYVVDGLDMYLMFRVPIAVASWCKQTAFRTRDIMLLWWASGLSTPLLTAPTIVFVNYEG